MDRVVTNPHAFDFKEGEVLLFDKPKGWTSFDLVRKVRYLIKEKKVGHAGTLDPLASGLMILCTGKKTKAISVIQDAPKQYIATYRFGSTTPSFDLETTPVDFKDTSGLTADIIADAMQKFLGKTSQLPPVYSAIKVDGKRAYESARKGIALELKHREIEITSYDLIEFRAPDVALVKVNCSKGTYIRTLAHDLGQALGTGAYMEGLVRTAIGNYLLADAWEIEKFAGLMNKEVTK